MLRPSAPICCPAPEGREVAVAAAKLDDVGLMSCETIQPYSQHTEMLDKL